MTFKFSICRSQSLGCFSTLPHPGEEFRVQPGGFAFGRRPRCLVSGQGLRPTAAGLDPKDSTLNLFGFGIFTTWAPETLNLRSTALRVGRPTEEPKELKAALVGDSK